MHRWAIAFVVSFLAVAPIAAYCQTSDANQPVALSNHSEQRILRHEVLLEVSLEEAWDYFTRADLVKTWMAPVADVDLRPGGVIKTNYNSCASLSDPGAIELKIVNFVPQRFLTLQSNLEVAKEADWMNETIYAQRNHLFNLIEFQSIGENRTRIVSWGLGYGTTDDWNAMVGFFDAGNKWSYDHLNRAIAGGTVWPPCNQEDGN